jgi:hypothetical protein
MQKEVSPPVSDQTLRAQCPNETDEEYRARLARIEAFNPKSSKLIPPSRKKIRTPKRVRGDYEPNYRSGYDFDAKDGTFAISVTLSRECVNLPKGFRRMPRADQLSLRKDLTATTR